MGFNGKAFFKTIVLSFLTLILLSCSMINSSTGDIHVNLPRLNSNSQTVTYSRAAAPVEHQDNQIKFKVSLQSENGNVFYNKIHNEGDVVFIAEIPVGKYEITIIGGNSSIIYEGNKSFYVEAGKENSVDIDLNVKEPDVQTPDPTPSNLRTVSGSFTGGTDPVEEITLKLISDNKNYSTKANSNGSYSFTEVEDGEYNFEIESTNYILSTEYFYDVVVNGNNETVDITLEKKIPKGSFEINFSNGNGLPKLLLRLFKNSDLVMTIEMDPSKNNIFEDICIGTGYHIEVSGSDVNKKYSFVSETFEISENNTTQITGEISTINKDIVTPNIENGIYCVEGDTGDDSDTNNGSKPFKTISRALKASGVKTIYVSGTVTETGTETIKLPNDIEIVAQNNSTAIVESDAAICFTMDTNSVATINGLTIIRKSTATDGFGIKIGDSGKLTLGKTTVVSTNGTDKNAISLGSQGTITLSSPTNIPNNNYLEVLNGGKIIVDAGFSEVSENITLNMEKTGGEWTRQIITAAKANELAASCEKIKILNNSYSINSAGVLIVN